MQNVIGFRTRRLNVSKFAAVPDSSDHVMAADSQLCGRSLNAVEVGESGASGAPATSAAVKGNGFLYPWPCFSRGPKSWSGFRRGFCRLHVLVDMKPWVSVGRCF